MKDTSKRLKRILNSIPAYVYWKDRDGVYLGCNRPHADLANIDNPEDIVGKTDYDLAWSDSADEVREVDKQVIRSRSIITAEEKSKLGEDEIVYFFSKKMPLYDDNGNIEGIIGVTLDITELKKTQQNLTAALEQAECAEKERKHLLGRYRNFVLNQEHDVRTPIAGVQGLAEALIDMLEDPGHIDIAQHLLESSTGQRSYQETLLDGIYLFNEETALYHRRFSLNEVLKRIKGMYTCSMKDLGITFSFERDSKIPDMLVGDWFRLQKSLAAIMSNAVKFTESGGKVAMRVKLVSRDSKNVVIAIEIEDTGEGIPKENLDTIFEPFERLTLSNIGKYEGRGLGLTMVKKMVDELGGEIEVNSEVGRGSIFRLLLKYQQSLSDDGGPVLSPR